MIGYWNKPEETASALQDGWVFTGDAGIFDKEGYLYIVDRVKDMVIRGGENIACIEVEGAIYEHSDILEACVFGIPDERLGEILCTSIYLKPGMRVSADELKLFLSDKLAAFKIPLVIEFSKVELPKIASGKFDKPALRKLFTENNQ